MSTNATLRDVARVMRPEREGTRVEVIARNRAGGLQIRMGRRVLLVPARIVELDATAPREVAHDSLF